MSLKDKLADFLFRQKPEQAPREEVPAEQAPAVESAQEPAAGEFNPALLELPSEHPLYRLYHSQAICPLPGFVWMRTASCRKRLCSGSGSG